ncbi:hypothetical protein PTSG_03451 [Salpingoeca rosetta]|uniref:60S acidic ribosomal protein P3 n=1 Tax=Salpingoeca rosetta (strain ATCC 50818 / BSB-021) TaxID=946362 RepID=F2U585_SALR5|nr:uncharacterized protein PTSG_03451 [Salpingoeca rosetta]EGD82801.1 hypothetical protein PTSG_03451 [Salpingoeca rosetta]|eukprot:XP_004996036.1 hypothetical protein PTSG_03451 [Salpingoeca rosetta]
MVYVFICKNEGGKWTAKGRGETAADLTAEGEDFFAVEKALKQTVLEHASYSGAVQISHTMVTPKSSVFVCQLGGAPVGGAAVAGASGDAGAPAAEEAAPEPEEEEESDDDMDGFSLFD